MKGSYSRPVIQEKKADEAAEPQQTSTSENKPVNQQQLEDTWKNYAEDLKNNDPRIYSTLTAYQPTLKENGIIEFPVSNPLQEDLMRNIRIKLLTYLRKNLNNFSLDIVTTITDKVESNRLYTAEDKFDHMAKQYPELLKLKQQFNLDFE